MKPIVLILAALCLPLQPAAAQDPAAILNRAATLCREDGITASFTLQTRSAQLSESFEGVIHIKGDKFTLLTPDMKTWYDGLTQWTYIEHTGEVNLTQPEGDDLQFTNPAILLASWQKDFTAAAKGEVATARGKTAYNIELTPRKRSDIVKVELQIEKTSGLPLRLAVQLKNKASHIIQISDIKTRVTLPDTLFTFPQADYPQAEIIDLR
jgi:outer membrane lipoprotein-sorting protein